MDCHDGIGTYCSKIVKKVFWEQTYQTLLQTSRGPNSLHIVKRCIGGGIWNLTLVMYLTQEMNQKLLQRIEQALMSLC